MATRIIYAALPAVAGFYFFDRSYVKQLRRGILAPDQKMIAERKQEAKSVQKPKLAPQFDGLQSFETIVVH